MSTPTSLKEIEPGREASARASSEVGESKFPSAPKALHLKPRHFMAGETLRNRAALIKDPAFPFRAALPLRIDTPRLKSGATRLWRF